MKFLQNQESFSFNSTSSKTGLFSDDEYGDADGGRFSTHQQNDYFEISLPPLPSPPPPPSSPTITDTNHEDAKEEEFEFCFSFNSSSTLPTTPISTSNNDSKPHTVTASQTVGVVQKNYNHHNKISSSINYGHIFRRASSPRCHRGFISPYVFRTSIRAQQETRVRTFGTNQRELVKNGSSGRLAGITKLLVKLRSIKCRLPSSMRLQPPPPTAKNTTKTSICNDPCYTAINACIENPNLKEEKSSKTINFNGFRKMFDVVIKTITKTRRSKRAGSKSCPVSIKSSPIHDVQNAPEERRNSFYSKDHSIQAAIAHCKKSFGK